MKNISIKSIYSLQEPAIGQRLTVSGWVRTVRSSKDFGFSELNDGSYFKNLQIVFDHNLSNFGEINKLGVIRDVIPFPRTVKSADF